MNAPLSAAAVTTGQRKAVFLDKDGTLVRNLPGNVDPDAIELLPGVLDGLQLLQRRGFVLFVVSNQGAIGEGWLEESQLEQLWQRTRQLLEAGGVRIEGFYYCPHAPGPGGQPVCSCRKPRPGLLWRAAVEHQIDLYNSWMIGDILDDVEAGHGAGCRSAMVDNGGETEWEYGFARVPDVIAHDFRAVVRLMEDSRPVLSPRRHMARIWL